MSENQGNIKNLFKKNISKELLNINGVASLLYDSIQKENTVELSKKQKEFISHIKTFSDSLAENYIPEILESQNSSKQSALAEANNKIRELEKHNSKSTTASDISGYINKMTDDIETILSDSGLHVGVSVSAHAYLMEIKLIFYPIRDWSFEDDFQKTAKEIEDHEKKKKEQKKSFIQNYDITKSRRKNELTLASSDKNISNILNIMKKYNSNINLDNLLVKENRKQTRYLSEMIFTLSNNNVFLGSRY